MCKELDAAISSGDLQTVKRLTVLDRIDELNGDFTALHWAALTGKVDILRFLIESGARVDIVSPGGRDALMYAVASKCVECVQLLLSHGANPNFQTRVPSHNPDVYGGHSTLMEASCSRSVEICKLLLDAGAQVNAQCESGWTALSWAVCRYQYKTTIFEYFDIIKILIDYGADPHINDNFGVSAFDTALEMNLNDVITLFQNH